jgi:hypothetical protein
MNSKVKKKPAGLILPAFIIISGNMYVEKGYFLWTPPALEE